MKKVYVVTSGSYSDYGIVSVFDNEVAANEFVETANRFGHENHRVEEYPINSATPTHRIQYRVEVDLDGDVVQRATSVEWEESPDDNPPDSTVSDYRDLSHPPRVPFYIRGYSYRGYEVALKAARDKLAQWKAEQAGL